MHGKQMKILIAEDEHQIAKQYKIVLEARKHHAVTTPDGEECLRVYRDALKQTGTKSDNGSPFDVVVLDYRMPGMNGMEVAKEILKLNPKQRIIFASAFVRELLLESAKELNQPVEFIQKPFKLGAIVDTIEGSQEKLAPKN
ncbi:MAG: response regulator [Nitrososphaerales archaeon]